MIETAERVGYSGIADNYVYYRQLRAYELTEEHISGDVLEIGSGQGYGLKLLSPKANTYFALDKYETPIDQQQYPNVKFIQATVPPLTDVATDSVDIVVSFQLIEHIKDDISLVAEIKRVLKPGGQLILTTPNIKTTLSRNPWHIREYTAGELTSLLRRSFDQVEMRGIYGDDTVMTYYEQNKASVDRIMKYDILDLQHKLPRWMRQVPFDIMNKRNRLKLSKGNNELLKRIQPINFYLKEVSDQCLDLYAIATA
ncbi:MAG: class I SAM-dependent methyltransferase [Bacteroidota bacterium]